MGQQRFHIGIDVGGTFTDVVACGGEDGILALHKVPTTPQDIARGIAAALAATGVPPADVVGIAHGTTVATNALLERTGARTALLTTAGFRDVLELRDGARRTLHGRQTPFKPLIPRQWRWEVAERLDASGRVLTSLAEEELGGIVSAIDRQGIEALAISFLHADHNDAHERRAREIVRRAWPGAVVLGSQVCPFPDERLRTATAALAAYLTPLVTRYVAGLERVLAEAGTSPAFRFIESAGGSLTPEEARQSPLQTILSGPAGGSVAGGALAHLLRLSTAVTADMGGTSFDVAILQEGQLRLRADRSLEFGLTVAVPCIDIQTVGIGGGSLAWMDESVAGGLQVGPQSAGALPGPACFGKGGRKPTVTDASLLLDRLVGDRTDLGLAHLDRAAAERSMLAEICPGLGTDPLGAAEVVLEVAEAHMAGFLRAQLAARGIAATKATLIGFGGAGPAHAAAVARRLGLKRVVVPYLASAFSALGCLLCPPAQVALLAVDESLAALSPARLRELCATAFPPETHGSPRLALVLRRASNPHEDLLMVHDLDEPVAARIRRYHTFTQQAYGVRPTPDAVRVVRLLSILDQGSPAVTLGPALEATFHRQRERWAASPHPEDAPAPEAVPRHPVESLSVGAPATGPALVVLPGASAFVPHGIAYHVDRWGNLIMETGP